MLEHLWPGQGLKCILSLKGGERKQYFVPPGNEAQVLETAKRLDEAGWDVYWAPASFESKSRTQDAVAAVQCFWADIDCGEGKPYKNVQAAVAAVVTWCETHSFHAPTVWVRSGNGLHVYWALASAITAEVWKPVAQRLKQAFAATGLRADPSRTADQASVLRIPGTRNHKGDTPKPVTLLKDTGERFTLEEFDRAIPVTGPRPVERVKVDSEWSTDTFPPADAERIALGCAQMAHFKATKGAVEEPLWRAGLSVLWRCVSGGDLIHDWSKGDPRYNPGETLRKAEGTGGPATCAHFASLNPEKCRGCKWAGKISSPIVLGNELPEPELHPDESPEQADSRINETKRYKVTARGVMKKGGEGDEETWITACPIWVTEVSEKVRHEGAQAGTTLTLVWHALNGTRHEEMAPQSVFYETRNCVKWLAEVNLVSQVYNVRELVMFISEMTREALQRRTVKRHYTALGWYGDTFVLGATEVSKDGPTPATVQNTGPLSRLTPHGTVEGWVEAGRVLSDARYWPHAFTLLAALGSPLLSLAGKTAAVLSLAGQSGSGKTLAGKYALAAFGNPDLLMQSGTATTNAITAQLIISRHVPFLLDEVTDAPVTRVASFIYEAANGKGKSRADIRGELRESGGWALTPIITTNRPLLEFQARDIAEAHRRRLLELYVRDPMPRDAGATLAAGARDHHGHAGAVFLQQVCKLKAQMPALLDKAEQTILSWVDLPDNQRFGLWMLSAALVAGSIAKQLGLIHFAPAGTVRKAALELGGIAADTYLDADRIHEVLAEYLVARTTDMVIWDGYNEFKADDRARDCIGRLDKGKGTLYLRASELNRHLLDMGLSLGNLRDWMAEKGVILATVRLRPNTPPARSYKFHLKNVGLDLGGFEV